MAVVKSSRTDVAVAVCRLDPSSSSAAALDLVEIKKKKKKKTKRNKKTLPSLLLSALDAIDIRQSCRDNLRRLNSVEIKSIWVILKNVDLTKEQNVADLHRLF